MNYHYIDYMIRERRSDELEECERRRLLRSARSSPTGLIRRAGTAFSAAIKRLKELRPARPAWLPAGVTTLPSGFPARGGKR